MEAEVGNSLEINYEKSAADAINKVKQDLTTKEIEQRLRQEIEKQKLNETPAERYQGRMPQRMHHTMVVATL